MRNKVLFFLATPLFLIVASNHVFAQNGDIIQINNLTIESISGSGVSGEIIASRGRGETVLNSTTCTRFESEESKTGIAGLCPVPPIESSAYPNYRISVKSDAKLLLRDREKADLSEFGKGDKINVFGIYNEKGTLEGRVVRNLTKPLHQDFIQLLNLEVAAISSSGDKTLFVIQRADASCQSFEKGWKQDVPCPAGINSPSQSPFLQNGNLPDAVKQQLNFVRKYEVKITSKTAILDRTKASMNGNDVGVGDVINVYGAHTEKDAPRVEAETLRDLSKPAENNKAKQYEGIIIQINQNDGSFIIRTRDGKRITVPPYFQVDNFVKLRGKLDQAINQFSEVTEVIVQKKSDVDPIPAITYINPGSGTIGMEAELSGDGFTSTGNAVNIGTAERVITNLPSPDGKTLKFIFPATLCIVGTACSQNILQAGDYNISVSNKNGLSNAILFSVLPLPPLTITTPSLPQGVENNRYSITVDARGGAGTYQWQISRGALPPGLQLTPGACPNEPCKAPLTIKGTPTSPGTYSLGLTLNSRNETTVKDFTLVIVPEISRPF